MIPNLNFQIKPREERRKDLKMQYFFRYGNWNKGLLWPDGKCIIKKFM